MAQQPTKVIGLRVRPGVVEWLDTAKWTLRASKTDIVSDALELYLALEAPADRPEGYELSREAAEFVARVRAAADAAEVKDAGSGSSSSG